MTESQLLLEVLEKICSCPPIATADSLRNLLRYLVTQAAENPGETVREAQIAGAVFGKTEGFDPRQDSTVRVQISRLRTKLAEYYLNEGARDEWLLELPRGTYGVALKKREVPAVAAPKPEPVAVAPTSQDPRWWYAAGGFATGVAATVAAMKLL